MNVRCLRLNQVKTVGKDFMWQSEHLLKVQMLKLKRVDAGFLCFCTSLDSVEIPEVKILSRVYALVRCSSLENVGVLGGRYYRGSGIL